MAGPTAIPCVAQFLRPLRRPLQRRSSSAASRPLSQRRRRNVVDRKWIFAADLCRAGLRGAGADVLPLPTGFLPTEDQGAAQRPVPPARRRDPGAHPGRAARRSSTILPSDEAKNVATMFTVTGGGGGGGASGQNTGQGFLNFVSTGTIARASRTAPTRSSSAPPAPSATSATPRSSRWFRRRSAASASRPASPWSCRTPAACRAPTSSPPATALLAEANADPDLGAVRLSDLPDVATLKVDIDQEKLAALGLAQARRQHHPVDRLGRPLRQRLHRSRPREARLCPGRRALSRRAPEYRRVVRARQQRHR